MATAKALRLDGDRIVNRSTGAIVGYVKDGVAYNNADQRIGRARPKAPPAGVSKNTPSPEENHAAFQGLQKNTRTYPWKKILIASICLAALLPVGIVAVATSLPLNFNAQQQSLFGNDIAGTQRFKIEFNTLYVGSHIADMEIVVQGTVAPNEDLLVYAMTEGTHGPYELGHLETSANGECRFKYGIAVNSRCTISVKDNDTGRVLASRFMENPIKRRG